MRILITGAAGFIGNRLCRSLLEQGHDVTGLDNLDDYYSVQLKRDRLALLSKEHHFNFVEQDLADGPALMALFAKGKFTHVINMAAQAGVRYSLIQPSAYIHSNLAGFAQLLEACRHHPVEHLVFASSSSVYGLNTSMPFSTADSTDHPASLYAATKKAGEVMAHSYSHLFDVPCTGLRLFTVYGPWGRPDMALFRFTKNILQDLPIDLYNNGEMQRDFSYIDDIADGVVACLTLPPGRDPEWDGAKADPASSSAPYRLFNVSCNKTVDLKYFLAVLENALGKKAQINYLPMQLGDVPATDADIEPLRRLAGFEPHISIEQGIPRFVEWFKDYYKP